METAVLSKRVWLYIINLIFHLGVSFGGASPFLIVLHFHLLYYILISLGIAIIFSFIFDFLLMIITHGYTLGSALVGVKYVASNGQKITKGQAFLRSGSETLVIFALIDLLYLVINRTERGAIDRLSDSFAIDIRR